MNVSSFFRSYQIIKYLFNSIHDEPFRGCLQMEGQKAPLPKICETYPTLMNLVHYNAPKEDFENVQITWNNLWSLLTSAFCSSEISNFAYIVKYRQILHFHTFQLILLNFESLNAALVNMVTILQNWLL